MTERAVSARACQPPPSSLFPASLCILIVQPCSHCSSLLRVFRHRIANCRTYCAFHFFLKLSCDRLKARAPARSGRILRCSARAAARDRDRIKSVGSKRTKVGHLYGVSSVTSVTKNNSRRTERLESQPQSRGATRPFGHTAAPSEPVGRPSLADVLKLKRRETATTSLMMIVWMCAS